MFGDLGNMMQKLKESQQKVAETKQRLHGIFVEGSSGNGAVKIKISANREVKAITIDDALYADKEALEDYLIIAVNDAIEKASQIHETEIAAVAKEGLPSIPGMDQFM